MPPLIESKHTDMVRVSALHAQISVNISHHLAKNNMKKSNLCVLRKYDSCRWLSELLQNANRREERKNERKIEIEGEKKGKSMSCVGP